MSTILNHDLGQVELHTAGEGRLRVQVKMRDPAAFVMDSGWTTQYDAALIDAILQVKGPAWICDELRRDEDPAYVENDFRHDVLGFVDAADFDGKRVLDFGCGCGASTSVISRLVPTAEITGIELDAPSLAIAERRSQFYDLQSTRLLLSPDPESLPPDIGDFDYILFSAVFEHLPPDERKRLLPKIWARLRPGGILFLNQTPHRYFPIEGHTTGLPLINYLPDGLAHLMTNKFSHRFPDGTDWPTLLRGGIRGGTEGEVLGILKATGALPENLQPNLNGIKDHLDLWQKSSHMRHHGGGHRAKVALLKMVKTLTGQTVVPNISLAIRKQKGPPRRTDSST